MTNAKIVFIGLASGLLTGVVILGVGGRIAMRVVALLARAEPGFSFGGTLEVLSFASLVGLASGPVFATMGKRSPGSELLKGAVFGALVFFVVVLLPGEAKNAAFAFPELFPVTIAMFAALFIAFGIALAKVCERVFAVLKIEGK
jgi:hypothetical protein